MSTPFIKFGGSTTDARFVPTQSLKARIIADARVLHWYSARSQDITLSGSLVTAIADRKGSLNGSVSATAANQPTYTAASAGYNNRGMIAFTGGTDKKIALSNLGNDLTGAFFVAMIMRRQAAIGTADQLFSVAPGTGSAVNINGAANGTAFQFFARGAGVNLSAGNAPDTTARLLFGAHDGVTTVKAALGGIAAATTATTSGAAPVGAGYIGFGGSNVPAYGDFSDLIVGNVDIFVAGNADLRALISAWALAVRGAVA